MDNAGFEQAIQSYAIHLLSLTYQKVPRSVLAEVCFNFTCLLCFLSDMLALPITMLAESSVLLRFAENELVSFRNLCTNKKKYHRFIGFGK